MAWHRFHFADTDRRWEIHQQRIHTKENGQCQYRPAAWILRLGEGRVEEGRGGERNVGVD
jgi:hypothetical protein